MRKSLLGILAALFIFSSCSEDVDLTAPYKDITVVYGLLNAQQDTHWVRIQKAFLGDGDALLYSLIPDSLYYPATLDAYVLGYNSSGTQVDSFHLERLLNPIGIDKDTGVFAAFNNVLYRGIRTLNLNYTYKIVVVKPNGSQSTSTTEIVDDVIMAYPPTVGTQLNWEPPTPGMDKVITVRWVSDAKSYAYQLGIRFHYEEWNFATPGNVKDTSFTYYFPMFKPTNDEICNLNQLCYDIPKQTFYGMIVNNIDEDSDLRRRFISLDILVLQATEEFYNYITINAPSLSYVQKVSAYTNIENGLGIWGSRTTGGLNGLNLNTQCQDSLQQGQYTWQLNFVP